MKAFLDFFRGLTLKPQGVTVVAAAFLPIFAIVSMFVAVPTIIEHFHADPDARWKVPMMASAPGLSIAILAPFAGYFADRFGRRPLLLAATFAYGLFGVAPFFLNDLNLVFGSRLLLGVSEAAILTVVNTLIGDYWDQNGRRNWLFLQGALGPFIATGVILVAGPLTAWRWNGMFLIYAIAFPVFLAMWAFLFEPAKQAPATDEDGVSLSRGFPWRSALIVGVATLFASVLYYVFIINGGLAFKEVGVADPSRLSRITAIPSLFIIAGAFIFWLLGKRSNAFQLFAFLLFLGCGLAGIGLAPTWGVMAVALVIQQTGAGMAVPTLIAWAQTKFPFEHRGRGMGLWSACFFLGQFVSPWVIHQIDVALGTMQGAFLTAGLLGLAGAALALFAHFRGASALRGASAT